MSTADLLAQIHAAPHDHALRSIYADALQAAGDPRGEFIALQLAHADPARATALLDTHWRSWLGPLAQVTTRRGITFRDGFVVHLDIATPPPLTRLAWHRIHRAAEWTTLEALRITTEALDTAAPDHLAALLDYAPLAALHTLDAPAAVLAGARNPRRPALRSIAVTAHDDAFVLPCELVHATFLIARRLGWHLRDPADTALWQLALDADLRSLTIAPSYLHANLVPHIVQALAATDATDASDATTATATTAATHRRPPELWYRFPDCHVAIRRTALEFRVQLAEPMLHIASIELLRDYESVLARFDQVTLVDVADTGDRTLFAASGTDAVRYLAAHPPPPPDPDADD